MARWGAERRRGETITEVHILLPGQAERWKNGGGREIIWRRFVSIFAYCIHRDWHNTCTLWHRFLQVLKWVQTRRQMERKGGECADCCVHVVAAVSVYIEERRREPVYLSQIVLCLFLEWRDRPSCHLLSLDWLRSLPVAQALHTKPALISGPHGVLALEF